ncbi:MAG: succinate dehydrogenase cytochrome b558 subunit [Planctomycetes bacterium]|nr:succinate dehydrogenase cytochrome b558 subunit [Planctomycetota bacterium]
MEASSQSFLERNDFVIRRLHSLSGLIPVGAFMTVHLITNATVLNGPGEFQSNAYQIHSLGHMLPLIEWDFIFLPILFHAIVGVVIMTGAVPNTTRYPYGANWRYTLQRWTGMIAFLFIFWHVFHMHGWFRNAAWLEYVAEPYGGARFRAYNAASTAGEALQNTVVAVLYATGVLACVFHLANGIWTAGITWGVWTSQRAQNRALAVCGTLGVLLALAGLGALGGMRAAGSDKQFDKSRDIENRMYESRVNSGELIPDEHKRAKSTRPQSESIMPKHD